MGFTLFFFSVFESVSALHELGKQAREWKVAALEWRRGVAGFRQTLLVSYVWMLTYLFIVFLLVFVNIRVLIQLNQLI